MYESLIRQRRFLRLGTVLGSYASMVAAGWLNVLTFLVAGGLVSTWVGVMPDVVLLGLAALMLLLIVQQVGYRAYIHRCRHASRAFGLRALEIVPESPRLMRILHRQAGLELPEGYLALAVHVDPSWSSRGSTPQEAAEEWKRAYREDWDRLLAGLAGRPVVLAISTFTRLESTGTMRAREDGWRLDAPGPLFAAHPAMFGRAARRRDQVRMFGGVVTERRVDSPIKWNISVFDCARAYVFA